MSRTLFVTALSVFAATPAAAQMTAPCPSGDYSIIRTSMIKPGGTMDGFRKAYTDHAKWYADHGYPDMFSYAMVMKFDPVAHSMSVDPGMIMTVHMHSTDVPPAKHDAGWDGYVKEYEANSTIVSTTVACMVK